MWFIEVESLISSPCDHVMIVMPQIISGRDKKSNEIWEAAVMKLEEGSVRRRMFKVSQRAGFSRAAKTNPSTCCTQFQTFPKNIPKTCFQEAAWLLSRPEAACSCSTSAATDAGMGEASKHHREKRSFLWDKGDLNPHQTFRCTAAIYHIDLQSQSPSSETDRGRRGCCGLLEERGGKTALSSQLCTENPSQASKLPAAAAMRCATPPSGWELNSSSYGCSTDLKLPPPGALQGLFSCIKMLHLQFFLWKKSSV